MQSGSEIEAGARMQCEVYYRAVDDVSAFLPEIWMFSDYYTGLATADLLVPRYHCDNRILAYILWL